MGGGDGGVSGLAAFCLSSGGPLNVSVFHRMIVTRPPSPMTHFLEMLVLQRHYTSLLRVADVVGDRAFVVPMFSERPAILTGVPLWLPGEFLKAGWYRVTGVFLVEHGGHVVGATRVSGGVVDGHGSGHGHIDWFGDRNGYW